MNTIKAGAVHHLALTVADSERSRDFYVPTWRNSTAFAHFSDMTGSE
jgi:hypothetical protein